MAVSLFANGRVDLFCALSRIRNGCPSRVDADLLAKALGDRSAEFRQTINRIRIGKTGGYEADILRAALRH